MSDLTHPSLIYWEAREPSPGVWCGRCNSLGLATWATSLDELNIKIVKVTRVAFETMRVLGKLDEYRAAPTMRLAAAPPTESKSPPRVTFRLQAADYAAA